MKKFNFFSKTVELCNPEVNNHSFYHYNGDSSLHEPVNQTIFREFRKQQWKKTFFLRLAYLLVMLNLVLIPVSFSQIITLSNVTIRNTTHIKAKGELLSNSGAEIVNDGIIDINGDFTNNSGTGLFGTSGGTVIFNGTNQTIGGSSVTNFNNLDLQASGTITLQNNILTGGNNGSNNGILTLGSSLMSLNSNELFVNNPNANAITSSGGFIVSETDPVAGYGTVKWMIGNNTGNYIFPFGNSTTGQNIPVAFEITSAGTGSNGYMKMATYPTSTIVFPNNRPLPTGLTSLLSYFGSENASNVIDRWWVMDVGNYTDNPVSSISFTYCENEWNAAGGSTNTIAENTLQAQSNDFTTWTPIPAGTINTTNNTLTITNVNFYNPLWTLAGSNSPLPMELLIFDAKLNKNEAVDINWVTATEVNNDYFTLEKSSNGLNFESFAIIKGAGNSSNTIHYNSVDTDPFKGMTYYRLKQTDFDEQFSYSEIKAVKTNMVSTDNLMVFPNPADDFFYIKFDVELESDNIVILDMSGKVIREFLLSKTIAEDKDIVRVDCSNFIPGMYVISIPGGQAEKIIIK